jgi:uracil-DNA glycosylase
MAMPQDIRLHQSWKTPLEPVFATPQMLALRQFLRSEIAAGKVIYPRPAHWFYALDSTPLDAVRVVILGQDPYHGPGINGAGQAMGLCFSVPPGERPPPSLQNIYKELATDIAGWQRPLLNGKVHGDLSVWAAQGVLLLNSVLTVEAGQPASHAKRGWENFTDAIIQLVAAKSEPVVFLLWGAYAQKKAAFIEDVSSGLLGGGQHLVLKSAHPSPLAAHNGFFGCQHFSRANAFLQSAGRGQIDWRLD